MRVYNIDMTEPLRLINKKGIDSDKDIIKNWLQLETQTGKSIFHFYHIFPTCYQPYDQKWYGSIISLGYTKVFLKSLSLYYDNDEEKSYQEYGEHCVKEIDSLQQMLVSVGVVAALILSLTIGTVSSDITISETAEEFFSETTLSVFYYIDRILILVATYESMYLIFMTTKMFWEIGLMYDIDMKIWWIRQSKVGPLYDSSDVMITSLCLSIPFSLCLYNPKVGLVALIAVLVFFIRVCIYQLQQVEILRMLHLHLKSRR